MHPLAPYIIAVTAAVLATPILLWFARAVDRKREAKLAASRPSESMESFVASFRPEVQPIARAIYAEFQQYTSSEKLPLRKSDSAVKTLRMEKEDLEDVLLRVAKQFKCRKPSKEDDRKFRGRETFEDFVEFIDYLRPVVVS
jgi:hypothetical protein